MIVFHLQMIQSEMSTKQPILFAIINDGEQMLRKGSLSQRDDIQIKLKSLAEQWQSVVRRVDQRKTIISNSLHQWIKFKESSTYLQKWLTEKLEFVSEFKTQVETIQDAQNGLAMLKVRNVDFPIFYLSAACLVSLVFNLTDKFSFNIKCK